MRRKFYGGDVVGRHPSFVVAWLILASPQAGSFCAALALLQHTITTTTTATRPSFLLSGARRCANKRPWKARLLRGPTFPILSDNDNDGHFSSSSRLLGEADSGSSGRSNVPANQIEAETQRLMSVPTIDLKLELQMRGVEHRDAFEKVDLARRLAESRACSPPSAAAAANVPPSATTTTAGRRDDDGRAASDTLESGEASPSSGSSGSSGGGGGGWKRNSSRSSSASSTTKATQQERAASQTAPERDDAERREDEDSLVARDVAAAVRMGKDAVTRELNGMGIAHSRLSDLSVLASQYASGRREARRDAKETRRFRAEKEVDRRLEAMRLLSSVGRAELESRLRAQGVVFSAQISELELATLLVAESGVGGSGESEGNTGKREGEEEEHGKEDNKGSSGWEGWTVGRWDRAASALPWKNGKKQEGDKQDRYGGDLDLNGEVPPRRKENGSEDADGWSVQGNTAGSNVDENDEKLLAATAAAGAAAGAREKASRTLQARADRMSSRDIMNALDDLGVRYRIPTPRPELQRAFVSAMLRLQREGTAGEEAHSRADGGKVDGAANGKIMPLSPYAAEEEEMEEGPAGEYRRQMGFETYHSALRWARQLTFDDVLEELRYRGVKCNPRADFSYLTRLLADEVLADEELMEADEEKDEGDYDAEVEMVMAMNAQDIIKDLRAGGERADVTLSKENLAQQLVLMNARSRNSGSQRQRPRPSVGAPGAAADILNNESGSGPAYRRDRDNRPEGRRRWHDATQQRGRGNNGFASSSSAGGGGGGGGGGGFGTIGDLLEFGDEDDGLRGGGNDNDDALQELEAVARAVGGAAWFAVQEAAVFLTGTASGLFPDAFPEYAEGEDGDGASGSEGVRETRRTRGGRRRDGARDDGPARRARAVRERAGSVRRAAASFAQSSANRAGLAVVRSAAKGVLRGVEAAADWAGGGVLAREHVLLFVAAFCLVFKRGLGSSVALLVLIRGGRVAMQKVMPEGWTARSTGSGEPRAAAAAAATATAGGGAAEGAGREASRPRSSARASPSAARATATGAREARRRPKAARPKKQTKNVRTKTGGGGGGSSKRAVRRSRKDRERRKPLWEDSDDDSDKGCVVM